MTKISEKEREMVREESRTFLNEFSRKLEKIKGSLDEYENSSESRDEEEGWESDQEFKEAVFQNAPFIENDFIIAEKGAWKK